MARAAPGLAVLAHGVWLVPRATAQPLSRRWQERGLFDGLLRHLAALRRHARGRTAGPRLAVVDTQSVKCIPIRGPRGYDAAKKVLGHKRVALVDADGAVLAVAVVPGNVQDRDCLEVLSTGKERWPSLREAVLDGALVPSRRWWNRVVA